MRAWLTTTLLLSTAAVTTAAAASEFSPTHVASAPAARTRRLKNNSGNHERNAVLGGDVEVTVRRARPLARGREEWGWGWAGPKAASGITDGARKKVAKTLGGRTHSSTLRTTPTELIRGGGSAVKPKKDDAYKSAVLRTSLLCMCAGAFGLGTMVIKGRQAGLEFFAGYIVEQSLSVDNLFIFIMLFDYFKVPAEFQSRVLNWGIIGAVSMRAVMIVLGVAAIQRFRWVMLFFAGILVVSSANLIMEKEEDHGDSSHLENNTVLKVAKWMCDSTDYYDGEKFFTMVDGAKKATPLLLCLICIELTDFVFAVDSIPAVLGVSQDTFIVYASNVFAICAMRSIYTLVSHAISDLPYLKPAVALVLGFVGIKMFAEFFHYKIGIGASLGVVSGILTAGAVASIISNKKRDAAEAAAAMKGDSGLTFKLHAAGGGEAGGAGNTPLTASHGQVDTVDSFSQVETPEPTANDSDNSSSDALEESTSLAIEQVKDAAASATGVTQAVEAAADETVMGDGRLDSVADEMEGGLAAEGITDAVEKVDTMVSVESPEGAGKSDLSAASAAAVAEDAIPAEGVAEGREEGGQGMVAGVGGAGDKAQESVASAVGTLDRGVEVGEGRVPIESREQFKEAGDGREEMESKDAGDGA